MRAKQRGIEGWVDVAFHINGVGTVENARVLAAYPSGIFEPSALRAVRQGRYSPDTERGGSIPPAEERVRIRFDLEGR